MKARSLDACDRIVYPSAKSFRHPGSLAEAVRAPGQTHCRPPWVPALRFAAAGMTGNFAERPHIR
jgi:hypothetical protein